MKLSDDYVKAFEEQGYVLVENFYPEEKRAQIAAAVRRDLPPWEEIKNNPPEGALLKDDFPYEQMIFNQLLVDPDLIDFIQRVLATEDIHFRYAHNWARYPVEPQPQHPLHIDNGNNSLLPPNGDMRYGQISSWYFPEQVAEDGAPMQLIPKPYGRDESKKITLAVPAGTQMIFNTYLWHTATQFKARAGQRYSVTRIYGRADHYWEGVGFITSMGDREHFRKFVSTLTARQREIFRFPPAGHPYYTRATLSFLESQYPGWNARGEYAGGEKIEPSPEPQQLGIPG